MTINGHNNNIRNKEIQKYSELFITKAQRFVKDLVRHQTNADYESISWNEIHGQIESLNLGLSKLELKLKTMVYFP